MKSCPVCSTLLIESDRQGILIDHCPRCRGVWLDRGELEKIMERSTLVRTHDHDDDDDDDWDDNRRRYPPSGNQGYSPPGHGGYPPSSSHPPKKKEGFFSRLFDFD